MEVNRFFGILLIFYCILVLLKPETVEPACNTCGVNSGVACTSSKNFQACVNGMRDTSTTYTCPTGYCVDSSAICVVGATPICTICNICSGDKRFACLDASRYAFCFGTSTPSNVVGTCPTGYLCNIAATAPAYCSPDDGTISVCSAAPPSTITATQECAIIGHGGRFHVPWDRTCKRYVYCYGSAGLLLGQYYNCQGPSLFNPVLQQCVANTDYTCPY